MSVIHALIVMPVVFLIGLLALLVYLDRRFGLPPNKGDGQAPPTAGLANDVAVSTHPIGSVIRAVLLLLLRAVLVLSIAVPSLVAQAVLGLPFFSNTPVLLVFNCTSLLGGLAWACLPVIRVGMGGGILFAVCWAALAATHIGGTYWRPASSLVVLSWLLATIALFAWLLANPPSYFPKRWTQRRLPNSK